MRNACAPGRTSSGRPPPRAFQRREYLEEAIQRLVLERFAPCGIGPDRLEFRHITPYWDAYSDFDCHLDCFPVGYVTTLY